MSCFYIWNCALHQEGVVSLWLNACLYLFKISGQFVSLYQRTCMTVSAKFIILMRNRNISFQVNEMIVKNIKHKTYFKFECFTWTIAKNPFAVLVIFLIKEPLNYILASVDTVKYLIDNTSRNLEKWNQQHFVQQQKDTTRMNVWKIRVDFLLYCVVSFMNFNNKKG